MPVSHQIADTAGAQNAASPVIADTAAAQHYSPQYLEGFPSNAATDTTLGSIGTLEVMEVPPTVEAVPFARSPLHDTPSMALLIAGLIAVELLAKIKEQIAQMDHPFEKRETKAAIIVTIRDTLWELLPESYSDESIDVYKDTVFEYIQQRYGGVA